MGAKESGNPGNQVLRQMAPLPSTASGAIASTAIGDSSWSGYTITMRARTLQNGVVAREHQGLQLTSHAGPFDDDAPSKGLKPGDISGGLGYKFSVWCGTAGKVWYLSA